LLSEIVEYVELIYANKTGDVKLYEEQELLSKMTPNPSWWHGFYWSTVKRRINTAKEKLETEPAPTLYERYAPWDIHRSALLEGGDGRRREVAELLEQLQELSVS